MLRETLGGISHVEAATQGGRGDNDNAQEMGGGEIPRKRERRTLEEEKEEEEEECERGGERGGCRDRLAQIGNMPQESTGKRVREGTKAESRESRASGGLLSPDSLLDQNVNLQGGIILFRGARAGGGGARRGLAGQAQANG